MGLSVTLHTTDTTTERDESGDFIEVPSPPRNLEVTSIYPRTSDEPGDPNRSSVITGMTILAPENTRISPHDEIEIPGYEGRWRVSGEIAIWDERSNPVRRRGFRIGMRRPGLNAGCVQINVEKVDG